MTELTWDVITKTYPEYFKNCYCGYDSGKGWLPIVAGLCAALREEGIKDFEFHQIKEKFGDIRIYWALTNDAGGWKRKCEYWMLNLPVWIRKRIPTWFPFAKSTWTPREKLVMRLITMAEVASSYTCEECGKIGRKNSRGWIKTLCDNCRGDQ